MEKGAAKATPYIDMIYKKYVLINISILYNNISKISNITSVIDN